MPTAASIAKWGATVSARLGLLRNAPMTRAYAMQSRPYGDVRCWLPAQPVDATQALNLSAGVSNAKVLRGRSYRTARQRCLVAAGLNTRSLLTAPRGAPLDLPTSR